jgi:uncharacterized repeat protein (TIGR03803 family)
MTFRAGTHGCGTVYRLNLSSHHLAALYEFAGGSDGCNPNRTPAVAPNGILYGATVFGGAANAGTVFSLTPPATFCRIATCYWTEAQLHAFGSGNDGVKPYGGLIVDPAGNLYGTTYYGGTNGDGTIWELSRSGGNWMESILHNFAGQPNDGSNPWSSLLLDSGGDLFGTTFNGGSDNAGTVFEMMASGSEAPIYNFPGNPTDGGNPIGGLIMDPSGNLYGTTFAYPVVFELSPPGNGWMYSVLVSGFAPNNCGDEANLARDGHDGNLYGATKCGGTHGAGNVFELVNTGSGYTYRDLYDFTGGSDGYFPEGDVTLDADGNLWGTASGGGNTVAQCDNDTCGTIWEITGLN